MRAASCASSSRNISSSLSRLITAQLFGIAPVDPMVYAAAAMLFVATACLACVVPALQAARVDPVTTLRGE